MKSFRPPITLIITLLLPLSAFAETETVNGITWTYTVSDGEASLGGGSWSSPAVATSTSGSITIPGTLGNYPVTSIGTYAFSYCSGLTSIALPDGVTSIGDNAFSYCSGLTSIALPDGVTSIGDKAFNACSGLTSIEIPDSVTRIYSSAFDGCYAIKNIVVPGRFKLSTIFDTVYRTIASVVVSPGSTNICQEAFSGCSSLSSIAIPASVENVGSDAFKDCPEIRSVVVPGMFRMSTVFPSSYGMITNAVVANGVTSIGWKAFSDCSGLTSITIPNSVTSIQYAAFSGCSGLTSITIPDSVTSIDSYAFYGCSNLTKPVYNKSGTTIWLVDQTVSGSFSIPVRVTSIGSCAFYGCSRLTSITIPNGVMWIGDSAFSNCSGLTSMTIPDGVTSIGDNTFYNCRGLTSITIPDSVTSIGAWAFRGCSGLTSITIPDGVTGIGSYAFYHCSGLTSMTIPDGVTSIGEGTFNGCSSLTSVVIPDSVTSIESNAFADCRNLRALQLPICFEGHTEMLGLPQDCTIVYTMELQGDSALDKAGKPFPLFSFAANPWTAWTDASVPSGSCLRSGTTTTNGTSRLYSVVSGSGTLSFDWMISAGRGDACVFVLDGVETNVIQRSSAWKSVSIDLGTGNHTLQWIYRRGTGSATGEDAAFVDNVDWRPNLSLQVSSAFGTPDPEEGTHAFVYGDSVAATVAEPEPETGVRRVFTGWTGTGSVPAAGTAPAVSFVVTNDSSLAWNWRTEYPLALSVSGPATADFAEGWVESGTTKVVNWTPTEPYFDVAISGDTSGVVLDRDERTLSIPANRARSVTLNVTERVIAFTTAGPVTTDFAEVWGEDADELTVHWTPAVPYFKVSLSGDTNGVVLDENARTLTIPTTRSRTFSLVVEELTLERALDTEGLVWRTDGAAEWFPQLAVHSDGEDAAQSGVVAGDDTSGLETVLQGAGTFSWFWKVSTDDNVGVDVLLDEEWLDTYAPGTDWSEESLDVAGSGPHVVRFEFWNAGSTADAKGWIDRVSWTGDAPFGARLRLVSSTQTEAVFSTAVFAGGSSETMRRTLEVATDETFPTVAKTVELGSVTEKTVEEAAVSGLAPETSYWARLRVARADGEERVSETVSFRTAAHVAPALGTPVADARAVGATISVPLEALGSDGGPVSVSVAIAVAETGAAAGTAVPATLDAQGMAWIEVSGLARQTVYRFVATARSVATGLETSISGGFTTDWGETPRIAAGGDGLGNLPALCFLPSATGTGEDFVIRIDNPVPGCWYPVYTNGTPAGRFAVQSCGMPESAEDGYVVRVPAVESALFVKIGVSEEYVAPGMVESNEAKWTTGTYSSFTPAALSGNLLRQSGVSYTGGNAHEREDGYSMDDPATMTDGEIDSATSLSDKQYRFAVTTGQTLSWSFPNPATLTEVRVYGIWGDSGRDRIDIEDVDARVGENWIPLAAEPVSCEDPDAGSYSNNRPGRPFAKLSMANGSPLATGVTALRIIWGTAENGFVGVGEVEAIGSF